MGFSREIPADLSQTDKIIMYKVPVFTGKVIDAETQKPVTKFRLVNGVRGGNWGDRPGWSDHYQEQIDANDGRSPTHGVVSPSRIHPPARPC